MLPACLAGLTLLAVSQEFIVQGAALSRGVGYETKSAASQGIALGSLSLPWVFGALWVSVHGSFGDPGKILNPLHCSTTPLDCSYDLH